MQDEHISTLVHQNLNSLCRVLNGVQSRQLVVNSWSHPLHGLKLPTELCVYITQGSSGLRSMEEALLGAGCDTDSGVMTNLFLDLGTENLAWTSYILGYFKNTFAHTRIIITCQND